MIRLKRDESGLIFEIKPPFNEKFFADLKATINDFMKIGKKSFTYDFKLVEDMTVEEANQFEQVVNLLKTGNCTLKILGATESLLAKIPHHKAFSQSSLIESTSNSHFSIETTLFESENLAVLNLGGEFMEPYSLEEFKNKSFDVLGKCNSIILDCAELTHISTLAVGGFVFLKSHCDTINKKVTLCNVAPSIYATLEMSGILHIIPVAKDLKEAKLSLS